MRSYSVISLSCFCCCFLSMLMILLIVIAYDTDHHGVSAASNYGTSTVKQYFYSRRILGDDNSFSKNYQVNWGFDHAVVQDWDVQLSLDQYSGAGFVSKQSYGSGFFQMRIKLPPKDSAGVVTAFYLTSQDYSVLPHDELDFEFLGNREGKPITLQTNVFTQGEGNREQRFYLWFDPSAEFHTYKLLWNTYQIVFYVDDTPIRVYENKTTGKGAKYPSLPMHLQVSLWDGESWATDGGRTKTDWNHAPFTAHFEGFGVDGCTAGSNDTIDPSCYDNSSRYWWNADKYWKLSHEEESLYDNVKNKYRNYDYCEDKSRFPTLPPECAS